MYAVQYTACTLHTVCSVHAVSVESSNTLSLCLSLPVSCDTDLSQLLDTLENCCTVLGLLFI